MACSGSHCASHGTGTRTCSGHRAACSTNAPLSVSTNYAVEGSTITANDINAIKNAIRSEFAKYAAHVSFANAGLLSTAYTKFNETETNHTNKTSTRAGTLIDNTHINDYETITQRTNNIRERVGVNYAAFSKPADVTTSPNSYNDGDFIEDFHWTRLLSKYNTLRQDCICNSDCACNLVCACHNDCGCNYSDQRLKENIVFVETKKGINWYSFNYIWDKTKKHIGVMAQEILETKYKKAVTKDSNGFYMINYCMLPK
jgi:hypothetical protein